MNDNDRRHWHGNPGDRHEHLNVWTQGGSKGPATRAAWALTPEMISNMRRGSDTSTSSTGTTTANANANANTNANTTDGSGSPTFQTVSERRRSSAGSGAGLFSNLQTQKRESTDPSMTGRKASWNEQREQGGFVSKWWEGYTRGK